MTREISVGQRFSSIYLVPPELLQDSPRMRRRLGALFFSYCRNLRDDFNREIGTDLPAAGSATADYWPYRISKLDLRDVLDAVTIAARRTGNLDVFLAGVTRIFDEEHVCYKVDGKGGVHFRVDAEFEGLRTSAIASLAGSRYAGVRDQYARAHSALDSVPPDGKQAIRSAFFSLEGLFRLIFPNAHQLSSAELNKQLKPVVDRTLATEKPALQVASKQLEALKDWIDGAHFYRHEPGSEEPNQPPLNMATLMVSQAGAYLRWLRGFDLKGSPSGTEPS